MQVNLTTAQLEQAIAKHYGVSLEEVFYAVTAIPMHMAAEFPAAQRSWDAFLDQARALIAAQVAA